MIDGLGAERIAMEIQEFYQNEASIKDCKM